MPLDFRTLLFVRIQAFLDRKLFTSGIVDIFHKCPFGLVIASLRVSGSPVFIEIDVMHAHWISSYSCSTIGMNLVSRHLVIALDDWLVHLLHCWVTQCI